MFRLPLFFTLTCALIACTPAAEPPSRAAVDAGQGEDLACLREAIYFEAGNVSAIGRRAVAHVVLNRAKDPRFPTSVCGVVREGEDHGKCQFSYRCQLDASHMPSAVTLEKATATARAVLVEGDQDPTGGALFFHAKWMPPGWFGTLQRVGEFGGNIFYRS